MVETVPESLKLTLSHLITRADTQLGCNGLTAISVEVEVLQAHSKDGYDED